MCEFALNVMKDHEMKVVKSRALEC